MAIVLAGSPWRDQQSLDWLRSVRDSRNRGIEIYSAGFGQSVRLPQLASIVRNPTRDAYTIKSYDERTEPTRKLVNEIARGDISISCNLSCGKFLLSIITLQRHIGLTLKILFLSGPLTPHARPVDWAYVVDSSDSVDWNSWRRYILENAQRYFKVTDDRYRVGLITYGDGARIAFPFNAAGSWAELINRTPQQGGSERRVDRALQLARDELFSSRLGARTDSRKVTPDYLYANLQPQKIIPVTFIGLPDNYLLSLNDLFLRHDEGYTK